MSDLEIRTELSLIRRDVDDIKLLIPEIRNALQQLAVTNAQLVANMDEHKIIWTKINGLQEKCEEQVIPHITVWGGHREEHQKLDAVLDNLVKEHAVCMAERQPKPETVWDKVRPQLVLMLIVAVAVLVLIHAPDMVRVFGGGK